MASEWQGGSNFSWVKRGSSTERKGGVGQGKGSNKNPALTKEGRFNANPTRIHGHPNCQIGRQAEIDRKKFQSSPRIVKRIPSGFKGI